MIAESRAINDRLRYDPTGSPLSYTNQDIDGRSKNLGHNFTGNIDYKLTPKDVISNSLNLNRRHANDGALAGIHGAGRDPGIPGSPT